jgi:2-C-methyl-D-erythritol 4-phosphate cytidylyltransferase
MEGLDKLFTQVRGGVAARHAVAAFEDCWSVDRIVVVLSQANLEHGRTVLEETGSRRSLVSAVAVRADRTPKCAVVSKHWEWSIG